MGKDYVVTLNRITCTHKGERSGDDLYIKYIVDGGRQERFPPKGNGKGNMKRGDTWAMDFPLYFDQSVVIELYDGDVGRDQYLGSTTYRKDDPEKEVRHLGQRDGDYELFSQKEKLKQHA